MTDQLDEAVGTGPEVKNGSVSPLETLRRKREELAKERPPLDLDIPGYDGELVARFRPLPWQFFKQLGLKIEKMNHPRKELLGHADVLINSCDRLMARVEGNLVDLDPKSEIPVKFEQRLAELFGFEAESARDVVFKIFNNDLAVTAMHNRVAQWMQENSDEADADFLGESRASRRSK